LLESAINQGGGDTAASNCSCQDRPVFTKLFRYVRALPFAVLLVFATALPVMAGPFEDAVGKFANDEFSDTEEAIGVIATSGNPHAYVIISALQDDRLMADPDTRKVYLIQPDGEKIDAATGASVDNIPDSAAAVRLNNRLRRSVEAALGGLTLQSPDPAKRIQAAQSAFKTHDETLLPAIDSALQKETSKGAKVAFSEARAAILLFKEGATDAEKLEAIATIKARGDQEALAVLTGLAGDQPPAVARAIANAMSAIQSNLAMWSIVQNAWYGLSLGSVLLLAAIGLAITFGVMGVINMAHGEMVMIGAYTTFVVQETIRTSYPGLFGYSLLMAVPLAFLVAGGIGILIERSIIRFLYGRPLETLLATWGLSLVLQQAVRTLFGPTNREVGNPSWMSGAFEIGQITITYNRLWILCFTLAVFAILLAMLRYTALGLEMRAVTQNRRMAAAMGIATSRVDALTFGLGSGIAGIAGVALSQIDNVSPNLGQSYIIDSFMVVVFGGVGNLWGTLVGAFTLGIANKFLEPVAGAVLGKIAILVLIILFIQKRPRGLFALKGRAVEA
jgi:urea transport system permease protein